jgi:RNA polymerase sigma factor (sigma-70 family)
VNTTIEERFLLQGLAQNDRKAVETIYKDHYQMVQTLVINNNGSADDARDIFQEAMIVLLEKSQSGSFELTCQLKTYIYAVCRRLWLKKLQQQQKYLPEIGMDEMVAVEEDLDAHDVQEQEYQVMNNSLQRLGEPCKSLLEAYYIQKKNMNDIARHFGYTNADNAKNQKYKCLMRLKKLFFAEYKNND